MVKVLIVDDEADSRELLVRGLERHGWSTASAVDGQEASRMIDGSYDAVVTDLVMPGMDGITLLSHITRQNEQALRVVITSFADKDRAVGALNSGAHYLIEKPFTARQLIDVVERLLARRSEPSGLEKILQGRLDNLGLSERERNLIIQVLKGRGNKEIADLMGITEQSVKNYLYQLYKRLGIGSRGELFNLVFPI
jgi:DNA-binding NarL/FixJ family response regulator